jgi:predicted ATPase
MARTTGRRLVEPLLREIRLPIDATRAQRYPFNVPTIAALRRLPLKSRVTFFVGENGTGKSTLLEAIALSAGLAYEGGTRNFRMAPRPAFLGESQEERIGELADALTLSWRLRPRDAFFLRAESFYNVVSYLEELGEGAFRSYGGESLHTRSHGESFLTLLVEKFRGGGLYLIDEPEAALSAARQLALLARMRDLLNEDENTQFIIASHSPIVLSFPGATIYSFDHAPIRQLEYRSTDAYVITRRFLENPTRALGELFAGDEATSDG